MSSQAANIIDFQAYRDARVKSMLVEQVPVSVWPQQPFLMWVPFMGFVPVMPLGNPNYGA
ncbi:hypothetical protein [Rhizobium rhizogenes]|uniref:hypothetical protein n=1 Tax=Rhizobium rhizogenes TaxID=359 RepID=UPI00080FF586|nr:hypothetical protein [Rhizobium rhizogenes]NTI40599.1 hypothetical protein [Rhizobium rhizogenes]OCJ21982.1 hypothetical protein A6U88_11665 [Agrobacterium sp. B131/95]